MLRILAGLLSLTLFTVTCFAAVLPSIIFDRSQFSVDPSHAAANCAPYRSTPVGLSASLPVRTVYVELHPGEHAPDLRCIVDHQDTLSEKFPIERITDITTSDSAALDAQIRAGRETIRPGFTPVQIVQEIGQNDNRYAELAVYPITITSDGKALFNHDITISTFARRISSEDLRDTLPADNISAAQLSEDGKPSFSPGTVDYIIITSTSLVSVFEPLKRYKQETGYSVEIVPIDSILQSSQGRDDAEKLRMYLKGFHARGGQYVLLGGDESVVPVRYVYDLDTYAIPPLDQQQVSDLYYANLTGEWNLDSDNVWGEPSQDAPDLTPQLFVGRLPLHSAQKITNYIDKLIEYETCSGTSDLTYLGRTLFFSSDQMRDYGYGGQHARIAASFPTAFSVDTASGVEALAGNDPNPTNLLPAELRPVLANGFGMINIIAHGRPDGFIVRSTRYNEWPKTYFLGAESSSGPEALDSLFAFEKPAFYYSIACNNASYDTAVFPQTSPGNFMCQKLLGDRRGAVAFVGYTRWGWVSVSYLMQAAFYDTLFAHPDRPAVAAMYASKRVYRNYRDLVYGQNFFGDPTLRLFTGVPNPVAIQITPMVDSLVLQVTSANAPLAYASIFLSQEGAVVGQNRTDENGRAVLVYPFALATPYTITAVAVGAPVKRVSYTRTMVTDVGDDGHELPKVFDLNQNYPNPFNPRTIISFRLQERSQAQLSVYNLVGQLVATLSQGTLSAGDHEVEWDGNDTAGTPVASGIYFYQLHAGSNVQSRKMVLLK